MLSKAEKTQGWRFLGVRIARRYFGVRQQTILWQPQGRLFSIRCSPKGASESSPHDLLFSLQLLAAAFCSLLCLGTKIGCYKYWRRAAKRRRGGYSPRPEFRPTGCQNAHPTFLSPCSSVCCFTLVLLEKARGAQRHQQRLPCCPTPTEQC
jgi:hypothetical protein